LFCNLLKQKKPGVCDRALLLVYINAKANRLWKFSPPPLQLPRLLC
jgi:hypothetical protein